VFDVLPKMAMPAIACIGVVAKNVCCSYIGIMNLLIDPKENPLHISLLPPFLESRLRFSFLINSCLDIFDLRQKHTSVDQDLGLLQALDERLAVYGWLTNTGVKLLIVVDLAGRYTEEEMGKGRITTVIGIKDSDLRPVGLDVSCYNPYICSPHHQAFRALQTAYVRLLQNPFYNPDEHTSSANATSPRDASAGITDRKFVAEVDRLGRLWAPGLSSI
jgi:hypothetical protein